MAIDWHKCTGKVWCDLFKLDLDHKYLRDANGVFIIWTESEGRRNIMRVGEGNISDELKKVKRELAFQAFQHLGLKVSWSEMSSMKRKGAVIFLVNELKPKMQNDVPSGIPVKVEIPWD